MDKRKWNGAKCAALFHSEEFFGLARSDTMLYMERMSVDGKHQRKELLQEMHDTLGVL
jgi:hypothetical protein